MTRIMRDGAPESSDFPAPAAPSADTIRAAARLPSGAVLGPRGPIASVCLGQARLSPEGACSSKPEGEQSRPATMGDCGRLGRVRTAEALSGEPRGGA